VNQKFHPGQHPDADRLSIFVEGADSAREREQMLAHLAACRKCRDVVFLMRRPVETASAAKGASKEWVWQRWLLPVGLAGAALAGLALSLVYLRPSMILPEIIRQSAALQQPEIGLPATPPNSNAAPVAQAENHKNVARGAARNTASQKSEGAADVKAPIVGSSPASASLSAQGAETDAFSAAAVAQTPPNPTAQLDDNSAVTQQLPLRGRNGMSVQPPARPPSASTAAAPAAAQDSVKAPQNFAGAQVGLVRDQDENLSGISGRVTDISGAVVAGATVALRDASGSARQTATGADGSFRLKGMPAGHYDLTVTAQGFKTNQQSIELKPSEVAMLQPVLNVGSVMQEVTVSAPLVETSTSVASIASKVPSRLVIASSVSVGKQVLSLDDAGTLFLSRNAGKSWKKVHPQWTGKAVRIDLIAPEATAAKTTTQASGPQSAQSVLQLTTDGGGQWTSKDGTRWRRK
jgi:hypothetical protein